MLHRKRVDNMSVIRCNNVWCNVGTFISQYYADTSGCVCVSAYVCMHAR